MIDMKLKAAKGLLFDQRKIKERTHRASLGALNRFGAFVRQRAITSMLGHKVGKGFGMKSKVRNRKGSSAPGQPPHPHTGLLVRGIEFVAEPEKENVVIGPFKIHKPIPMILKVLEHGGRSLMEGSGRLAGRRWPIEIKPRPFMRPAFDKELPKAAYLWANSIR